MTTQTYRSPGDNIEVTAPYDRLTTGLGVMVGSIFGVNQAVCETGDSVVIQRTGLHYLDKTSAQAWTQGDLVFWNASTKKCDNDPTTGKCIGVATADAADPSSKGYVLLTPGMSPLLEGKQATVAAVATADADATYGSPEATLINELKTQFNDLLAKLKIQGLIA